MIQTRRWWFGTMLASSAFLFALAGTPACGSFGSTKVGHGELYQSGDMRYDAFFQSVHEQQAAAGAWDDEKKAARKPLVTALSLSPGASDTSIVDALKRAGKDGSAAGASDETRRLESERARRLKATGERCTELAKQGGNFKEQAKKEYENRGADKADEKKSEKSREVRRELGAAEDEMETIARDAKRKRKDAEDFIADLEEVTGRRGSEARPAPKPEEPKAEEPKAEKPKPHGDKPKKPKPAEKPEPPAEKPAPPKPASKPPGEVFNP